MRILIVGAGALGGLVGARLTEAGEDVVLLDTNKARVKLLNEQGLLIAQGAVGERRFPVRMVSSVEGMEPVDLCFVSVKTYQTEGAVRSVLPVMGPHTKVLSLQNGIGNTEIMAELLGPERVLTGITYHSIQHVGPNRLRFRQGVKPIQIAPYSGVVTPDLPAIAEVFQRAGLACDVKENVDHAVWQKLLHNAVVNPVSALTGLTCSELLEDDYMQVFMRALCMEIIEVMRARGVPIVNEEDPYIPITGSQRALAKNRPSMWQDLARGFLTEVDALNGAVCEQAGELGLDAPLNFGLVQFIHSRERKHFAHRQRTQKTLDEVRASREAIAPTGLAPLGGMPQGRVPLESAPKLKEMIRDFYRDLGAADADPRRRVAWCSGMGPVELVRAFGLTPYFPETHAALIAASRRGGPYISRAMAEGFSPFVSSEMTCDIGANLSGSSPLVDVAGIQPPKPDVLVYNTAFSQSLISWFEYYANLYDVPRTGLHPPPVLGEVDPVDEDTAVQQMLRLAGDLEGVVGDRLDQDRLAEVVDLSARAGTLWGQILDLAVTVPSPLTYFDTLIHMAAMAMMRGTAQCVDYYHILRAELEDRVANGVAAVPGERYRFYWEGPPIWCALRPLASLFLEQQIAVVGSSYPRIFDLQDLDHDNPIASMSRAYLHIFPNRSRDFKGAWLRREFEKYGVDAVVYHDGRTSPEHSNVRYGLHIRLQRETGLPALVLEADSCDLRLFSEDQLKSQIIDFIAAADQRAAAAD